VEGHNGDYHHEGTFPYSFIFLPDKTTDESDQVNKNCCRNIRAFPGIADPLLMYYKPNPPKQYINWW
jgi:hypothetical protein